MKTYFSRFFKNFLSIFLLILTINNMFSQEAPVLVSKSDFWNRVQFGGSFGLNFNDVYTDVFVAPTAIYNFSDKFAVGSGLQFSYVSEKNIYNATMYGVSIITLINPVEDIQFSIEIEQLRVVRNFTAIAPKIRDNFWNTALFVGGGYNTGDVTVGVRYNLLYNKDKNIYGTAFLPFVRVFF